MSRDLVLFAPAQDGGPIRWARVEAGRRKRSGEGLPPVPEEAFDRLIVVLPSSELFVSRIHLAARSDREARQAAPFVIEDELAAPVEATAFAVGPAAEDGMRWIYAARRPLVDHWRRLAEPLPARRVYFVPDAFAVLEAAEDLVIFGEDGDLLLCRPRHDRPAMRLDSDMLAETLPVLLTASNPDTLAVSENVEWTEIAGVPLPRPRRFAAFDLAVQIAGLAPETLAKLPGFMEKSTSAARWVAFITPFRRAGLLALAAAVVAGLMMAGEGIYYRQQRSAIDDAGTALFASAFPETRIVNPEVQLRQRLAAQEGTGGSDFLVLARAVAELGRQVETVQIDTLRFDRSLNVLNVSATYSDFADFEALNAAAASIGVTLEDGGVRQNGDVLNGDFAVRLP
ncbi:type II secretion system protein GspL [Hyphobacterium indicum]|uniref:type II secretion system protein GspL n=1 Tax=Hyphobacterium indicum TaxID=2162714 RepID=UPI000D650D79|nr:type II secretion system protein GspL [Hyphobacterium indicum]